MDLPTRLCSLEITAQGIDPTVYLLRSKSSGKAVGKVIATLFRHNQDYLDYSSPSHFDHTSDFDLAKASLLEQSIFDWQYTVRVEGYPAKDFKGRSEMDLATNVNFTWSDGRILWLTIGKEAKIVKFTKINGEVSVREETIDEQLLSQSSDYAELIAYLTQTLDQFARERC